MPPQTHKFWHQKEEQRLKNLLNSDTPLQEIAQLLERSTDAIVLKAKRLDLKIPESWRTERKTTKSAFQALSWIHALLSDVKDMKDVEKARVQVDKALETLRSTAAKDFQQNLQPERMQ